MNIESSGFFYTCILKVFIAALKVSQLSDSALVMKIFRLSQVSITTLSGLLVVIITSLTR